MLSYCLYVDRCVDEMAPNVGAPPEERGRISNLGNGEEFLENEATTSTASISGHHHSPKWEPEEIDAPACMFTSISCLPSLLSKHGNHQYMDQCK
jgi:hypothetical protein